MRRWLSWGSIALLAAIVPFAPLRSEPHPAPASTPPVVVARPAVVAPPAVTPSGFASDRSAVELTFADQRVPYRVMGVFALPGEAVAIQIPAVDSGYRMEAEAGILEPEGPNAWRWTAPASPGATRMRLVAPDGNEAIALNAFVLAPYADMKAGVLNGYRIGAYPAPRAGHAEAYARPRGFVPITAATADLQVSPHFRLIQFACKSGSGLPKYAVVQPRLLLRLEGLLAAANDRGIHAGTFQLMSAYRTPLYNRGIGNVTTFTRHQYGDAADIFVDEAPRDGRMDDLNGDGRFDRADAAVLERVAVETETAGDAGGVHGGLSAYAPTPAHGAFVHVDTRGFVARW